MAAQGIANELSPMYVGARAIALSLADPNTPARARAACSVNVDYSAAEPEGVYLPLELIIVGPNAASFVRRMFRRVLPSEFSFTPIEGGAHKLLLREVGHNRWKGSLTVDVLGDTIGVGS